MVVDSSDSLAEGCVDSLAEGSAEPVSAGDADSVADCSASFWEGPLEHAATNDKDNASTHAGISRRAAPGVLGFSRL